MIAPHARPPPTTSRRPRPQLAEARRRLGSRPQRARKAINISTLRGRLRRPRVEPAEGGAGDSWKRRTARGGRRAPAHRPSARRRASDGIPAPPPLRAAAHSMRPQEGLRRRGAAHRRTAARQTLRSASRLSRAADAQRDAAAKPVTPMYEACAGIPVAATPQAGRRSSAIWSGEYCPECGEVLDRSRRRRLPTRSLRRGSAAPFGGLQRARRRSRSSTPARRRACRAPARAPPGASRSRPAAPRSSPLPAWPCCGPAPPGIRRSPRWSASAGRA